MVSRDKLDRKGPISVNILNMIFFYLLSIEIKEPTKLDEKFLYSLQTSCTKFRFWTLLDPFRTKIAKTFYGP